MGASLTAKLDGPRRRWAPRRTSAEVKVDLPKQLPSRLTTLQKACTAAQFDANPAGCPAASVIGHAKAVTPDPPVPLEGPAYFVSHGGEAFPSLIVVLQGYGVTIDLVGTTFISKAGDHLEHVQDRPRPARHELRTDAPRGQVLRPRRQREPLHSQKLAMPTAFVAQNGAEIHQSTKIAVTGCPKAKKTTHKQKHKTKKQARRGHNHERSARRRK